MPCHCVGEVSFRSCFLLELLLTQEYDNSYAELTDTGYIIISTIHTYIMASDLIQPSQLPAPEELHFCIIMSILCISDEHRTCPTAAAPAASASSSTQVCTSLLFVHSLHLEVVSPKMPARRRTHPSMIIVRSIIWTIEGDCYVVIARPR